MLLAEQIDDLLARNAKHFRDFVNPNSGHVVSQTALALLVLARVAALGRYADGLGLVRLDWVPVRVIGRVVRALPRGLRRRLLGVTRSGGRFGLPDSRARLRFRLRCLALRRLGIRPLDSLDLLAHRGL